MHPIAAIRSAENQYPPVGQLDRIVLMACGSECAERLEATGSRIEDFGPRVYLHVRAPPAVAADDQHAAVPEECRGVAFSRQVHRTEQFGTSGGGIIQLRTSQKCPASADATDEQH